jgi:Peptidase family M49
LAVKNAQIAVLTLFFGQLRGEWGWAASHRARPAWYASCVIIISLHGSRGRIFSVHREPRRMHSVKTLIFFALIVIFGSVMASAGEQLASKVPDLAQLQKMTARFAPTELNVDIASLSDGDRKALVKLVKAARLIDDIFMMQYWSGDLTLYAKLQKDTSPLGKARLHYFWINKSPWSELDNNTAFIPGVPEHKLPGANFYPETMTKEQFESWAKTLPEKQQEQAKGFFTVIRSDGKSGFKIVPYSEAYKADLTRAAGLLKEAASLTDNATLKRFLNTRAAAFLSNDYYESDVAWMDLDAPLDITIGPYETYNDELFGYKASYEAYVNVRDEEESAKLGAFSKNLQEIEDHLPIDPKYRNPKIGTQAPIRVVNEVMSAGDGNHGVQTAAYNLPNDERVIAEKGSKRVMLKNVQQAKFDKTLIPISRMVLGGDEQDRVEFEAFFTHILTHELCHGLGPHQITMNGKPTTPREQLKDLYSAIEEAKADVTGLFALQYMLDHAQAMGLADVLKPSRSSEKQLYATYLASSFRTLRFGLNDAHGKGMAVQVNYLMDKGAFVMRPDETFGVDYAKIKDAVRDLTHDLLTVEAEGNYAGAKQMLDTLGVLRPEFKRALDKLGDIPVDIEPIFVTAEKIAPHTVAPHRQ